jgi:hypothetical protein
MLKGKPSAYLGAYVQSWTFGYADGIAVGIELCIFFSMCYILLGTLKFSTFHICFWHRVAAGVTLRPPPLRLQHRHVPLVAAQLLRRRKRCRHHRHRLWTDELCRLGGGDSRRARVGFCRGEESRRRPDKDSASWLLEDFFIRLGSFISVEARSHMSGNGAGRGSGREEAGAPAV